MPGRDYSPAVDGIGKIGILISIAGVILHGSARGIARFRKRKREQ